MIQINTDPCDTIDAVVEYRVLYKNACDFFSIVEQSLYLPPGLCSLSYFYVSYFVKVLSPGGNTDVIGAW